MRSAGARTAGVPWVIAGACMACSVPAVAQMRAESAPAAATSAAQSADAAPEPTTDWANEPLPGDDFDVAPIDPDQPLDPLPDLDVAWPDFDTALPALDPLPAEADDRAFADLDPAPLPAPIGDPAVGLADAGSVGAGDAAVSEDIGPVAIGDAATPAALNEAGSYRYSVEIADIAGIDPAAFRSRFSGLSRLDAEDGDPANAAQLNRRILEDSDLLSRMLRNEGFYDATIASAITSANERLIVRFSADPGPQYRYDAVRLPGLSTAGTDEAARLRTAFPIAVREPIIADALIAAQVQLQTELLETGYPFGDVGEELVTIDHDTRLGVLDQPVSPGRRLRFGRVIANDDGLLGAAHIAQIARFDAGDWYRQSDVEDLRRALIATGLVASVGLTPTMPVDADPAGTETVDLTVDITPAPLRTLAGSLGYSSGEGFRAEASWEHRNLFPPEGALIVRGVVGTQEQLGSVTFRRNNFLRRDRTLTVQALAGHLSRDAFDAYTTLLTARLERQSTLIFQKRWTWSVGADLIATDERSFDIVRGEERRLTYFVGALPLFIGHDRSDSLLDPTRGFRLSARVSPEASFQDEFFGYARVQIDGSAYFPVNARVVLAGRVRVGAIAGADAAMIAPSRRYYAGGGGSVRGYGYQAIGARDVNNDPIGGQSVLEVAAEARVRLGMFSVVPFIDAGNVYDSTLPGLNGLRFGAGLGVRYHSSFGPIRVDIGTPLNPRPGDSRVGVYVSLGQAF